MCFHCSVNVQNKDIVQYCELIAGHIAWLFTIMCKILMKLSEKADQTGVYSSILVSSCDIIESITFRPTVMLAFHLAKQVSSAGNTHSMFHCGYSRI